MKAAELFVKCLENEGVDYIFGVPGEENIDLMDALHDSPIKFIVTRHETGAAFMAAMIGRLTGKPGVCLSTLGPGATNMLTGVADANMDKAPVVAITGQAGLNRQHKASHQSYDIVSMYRPVTKWNSSIKSADTIPEIVRKAFKVAAEEKPGATHIELPEDIANTSVNQDNLSLKSRVATKTLATDPMIKKAAEQINQSSKPIVLVGNGVTRSQATEELKLFAEKLNAPVTETFMGKGALPSTHPLYTMATGLFEKDYIDYLFEASDLVITIGYDMTEMAPQKWNQTGQIPVLHIDSQPAEIDSHYPLADSVVGDISQNLSRLTQLIDQRPEPSTSSDIVKLQEKMQEDFSQHNYDEAYPLKPQKIISDLRKALNDEDIVISDVGAHKMWLARMYPSQRPNTCLISNGLASMGFALPGAIGAKLVHPDRQVVAVVGDGGFLMTGSELETAVRLRLPIIILILRDEKYGLIEWKQEKEFGRASNIEFGNPDFIKLAEAFSVKGIRVNQAQELDQAIEQARKETGPVIIDCPIDYRENMKLTNYLCKIEKESSN